MKFENDLFVGQALCILRSPTVPLDPFYASHFDGRERMFDFQVQRSFSSSSRQHLLSNSLSLSSSNNLSSSRLTEMGI